MSIHINLLWDGNTQCILTKLEKKENIPLLGVHRSRTEFIQCIFWWKCESVVTTLDKRWYTFQTNLWNHSQFQLCRSFSQIGLNVSMMVNVLEMRMYFYTLCITMFSMFCLLTGYQEPAHVGLWISVVGKNLFFFRIVLNRWSCLFQIE